MKTNQPNHFVEITRKHMALAILRVLNRAPQYCSNEYVIVEWLATVGLKCSNTEFQQVIGMLEGEGFIEINSVSEISVLNLTKIGGDVADGLNIVEGVARPEPDSNY